MIQSDPPPHPPASPSIPTFMSRGLLICKLFTVFEQVLATSSPGGKDTEMSQAEMALNTLGGVRSAVRKHIVATYPVYISIMITGNCKT